MVSLTALMKDLLESMNEMAAKLGDREEKLDSLYKRMSEFVTDYESATVEIVQRIHKQRDEQVPQMLR